MPLVTLTIEDLPDGVNVRLKLQSEPAADTARLSPAQLLGRVLAEAAIDTMTNGVVIDLKKASKA